MLVIAGPRAVPHASAAPATLHIGMCAAADSVRCSKRGIALNRSDADVSHPCESAASRVMYA
jgi:hypothetical protein